MHVHRQRGTPVVAQLRSDARDALGTQGHTLLRLKEVYNRHAANKTKHSFIPLKVHHSPAWGSYDLDRNFKIVSWVISVRVNHYLYDNTSILYLFLHDLLLEEPSSYSPQTLSPQASVAHPHAVVSWTVHWTLRGWLSHTRSRHLLLQNLQLLIN